MQGDGGGRGIAFIWSTSKENSLIQGDEENSLRAAAEHCAWHCVLRAGPPQPFLAPQRSYGHKFVPATHLHCSCTQYYFFLNYLRLNFSASPLAAFC